MNNSLFSRLPKRLAISFPIWGLYDIDGKGFYADTDKMMREHKERGFNCIRLDDGAGIMHDLFGNPRGPVRMGAAFGEYDKILRQFDVIGGEGYCDPLERLVEIASSAKKHGMYLILSSWYYLHTYWFCHDKELNDSLFSIPHEEKFMAFAKFLHYIIEELKKRDLSDVIAFAEIFNEADGLYFTTDYAPEKHSDEECSLIRERHEQAIAWLKEKHPDILFGYDSFSVSVDLRQIPRNIDVLNFHSYYMWSIYSSVEEISSDCFTDGVTLEEVAAARPFRRDEIFESDWYGRILRYSGLRKNMLSTLEMRLEENLTVNYEKYRNKAYTFMKTLDRFREDFPTIPVVCGEGVTYVPSKELLWEEHSEKYWELVEDVVMRYREKGMWGPVVRTCLGPEDPAWNSIPDKILRINRAFLGNEFSIEFNK